MNYNPADFLAELAAGIPALPRAACRGRADLFTSEQPDDISQAVEVCTSCAELARCRAWAADQPRRALLGIVGGEHYTYKF